MATIEIDLAKYVRLLVKAGESDPANWPEGLKEGATLLGRISQIEQLCREEHGEWDWELISDELQDEYDACRSQLNQLRSTLGERPTIPAEEAFASIERKRGWLTE